MNRNFSLVRKIHNLVSVDYHIQNGYKGDFRVATIKMNHPPVNALSTPLLTSLNTTFKGLFDSKDPVDGIIITSSLKGVFSAGLELSELAQKDRNKLTDYYSLLQDLWYYLYSSRIPTVAAINGHCLAGGTVIAVASDYRIALSGRYNIGVTAAKLGVVTPPWFLMNIEQIVGCRRTELMLTQAKLLKPEDALNMRLIDEICTDEDNFVDGSIHSLVPFMEVHEEPRIHMKMKLRHDLLEKFRQEKETERNEFVNYMLQPSVQTNLCNYIKTLKTK
jgi:3,2-trans-enoyl-CoA isomerase